MSLAARTSLKRTLRMTCCMLQERIAPLYGRVDGNQD